MLNCGIIIIINNNNNNNLTCIAPECQTSEALEDTEHEEELKAYLNKNVFSLRLLLTLQLTSEESVSRHVSVQMVDILNIFVNKLLKTIIIINEFWFKCLLSIV